MSITSPVESSKDSFATKDVCKASLSRLWLPCGLGIEIRVIESTYASVLTDSPLAGKTGVKEIKTKEKPEDDSFLWTPEGQAASWARRIA